MITYQVETLEDFRDEIQPLLESHCDEVHHFKDDIPLSVDWEKYQALDKAGILHSVIVRDEGKLIGYFISFINTNMHYKEHSYAVNDILYVEPEYRNSSVAYNMFKYAEKCYKELGVSVFTVHMKKSKTFETLCSAVGLEEIETTYGRRL